MNKDDYVHKCPCNRPTMMDQARSILHIKRLNSSFTKFTLHQLIKLIADGTTNQGRVNSKHQSYHTTSKNKNSTFYQSQPIQMSPPQITMNSLIEASSITTPHFNGRSIETVDHPLTKAKLSIERKRFNQYKHYNNRNNLTKSYISFFPPFNFTMHYQHLKLPQQSFYINKAQLFQFYKPTEKDPTFSTKFTKNQRKLPLSHKMIYTHFTTSLSSASPVAPPHSSQSSHLLLR